MNLLGTYCGLKIIIQPPVKVKIKRSWKERLFSRPWKPCVSHNIEYHETLKKDEVIKTPCSIIMNQETYEIFKQKVNTIF